MFGAQVPEPDAAFFQCIDHPAQQPVPLSLYGYPVIFLFYTADALYLFECILFERSGYPEGHPEFGTQGTDQVFRCIQCNDTSLIHDRHPVAKPLRLLHEVGGQHHRFSLVPDPQHKVPYGPAGMGVRPGGQFVQEYHLGIVDQCKGDEELLFLAS